MENKIRIKRNGEIEFWRWIFCLVIFIYHINRDFLVDSTFFVGGNIGVEFFFIVSGFFLTSKACREKDKDNSHIGKESLTYVVKKYIGILPYHIIAFVFGFLTYFYGKHLALGVICKKTLYAIPQFFMIHMNGFNFEKKYVVVEWYISCLLIVTLLMYPVMRKYFDRFVYIGAPLIALAVGGFLANKGSMLGQNDWAGFSTNGMLRAIFDMCLGTVSFVISNYIKEKNLNIISRVVITLAGFGGYLVAIAYACTKFPEKVRFIVALLLMFSVAVSMCGKNFYGKVFNNKAVYYLGRISLPFYLNTGIIRFVMGRSFFADWSYTAVLITSFVMNFVFSAVVMFIVEYFKKRKIKSA